MSRRPDVVSFGLMLLLSAGMGASSRVAGFSLAVAGAVGVMILTVGCWASASEP